MPSISIFPKQLVIRLLSVIPLLLVLQCSLQFLYWAVEPNIDPRANYFAAVIQRFNFDQELSIPTWYSATLLLIGSVLFEIIARTRQGKDVLSWRGLAILFLYLSIDEASSLHELSIRPLRDTFNLGGVLHFSWVVIAIPLLLILCFSYFKFFKALPQRTRRLLLLAIGLYIGGALGVEFIGGYLADTYPSNRLIYFVVTTIEEVIEMLGINVLIYALLTHIACEIGSINLTVHQSAGKRKSQAEI